MLSTVSVSEQQYQCDHVAVHLVVLSRFGHELHRQHPSSATLLRKVDAVNVSFIGQLFLSEAPTGSTENRQNGVLVSNIWFLVYLPRGRGIVHRAQALSLPSEVGFWVEERVPPVRSLSKILGAPRYRSTFPSCCARVIYLLFFSCTSDTPPHSSGKGISVLPNLNQVICFSTALPRRLKKVNKKTCCPFV